MAQGTIRISRKDAWKYQKVSHPENCVDWCEATVWYNDDGSIAIHSYTSAYQKELNRSSAASDDEDEEREKPRKPKKPWKNKYWQWCRETFDGFFWILSPILFVIWFPFWLLKIVLKIALTIVTFGLVNKWLGSE